MKRFLSVLLALLMIAVLPLSAAAAIYTPDREIYAEAYMLFNITDGAQEVIAQKNQDEKMYPASLTKIATAMVTLENVTDLSETVTVSRSAYDILAGTGAQVAGLQPGDVVTVEQLLCLSMVHSACDACEVLAEYVGGTVGGFADMMNEWAQKIGCTSTHFTNPDGLHDENHYTTAADMAKITLAALQNNAFVTVSTAVSYEYRGTTFYHTNLMLQPNYISYYYKGAEGIKTGSTDEAGYCVITRATRGGCSYLAIVLGSPRIDYNGDGIVEKCSFIDAGSLFDWAFDSLKYSSIAHVGDVAAEVPVKYGRNSDSLLLTVGGDVNAVVPDSFDLSAAQIVPIGLPEAVSAPIEKGEIICEADIVCGGQTIAHTQLVAADGIELSLIMRALGFIGVLLKYTPVKIIAAVLLFILVVFIILKIQRIRNMRRRKYRRRHGYRG